MADIVVIRPGGDDIADALSEWADDYLGVVPPGLTVVTDEQGPGLTRTGVEAVLGRGDLVIFLGHGYTNRLVDENDVALVDDQNVAKAAGKIVVAVACESGDQLARAATGTAPTAVLAYLGCTEPWFVYLTDTTIIGQDVVAALERLEPSKGTIGDARDELVARLLRTEDYYRIGGGVNDADALMLWMGARMIRRGLRDGLTGDSSATLP